MNDDGTIQRFS